jgi:hypothetical protein
MEKLALLFITLTVCNADAVLLGKGGTLQNTSSAPAPAAAVGYNTNTFSSNTLGTTTGTWQQFTFYGNNPATNCGGSPCFTNTQNGTASFTMTGAGNSGGDVVTAVAASNGYGWSGVAFGGGMYAEVQMSFTGQTNYTYTDGGVAWWMLDVEHSSQGPYPVNWPAGTITTWNAGTTYGSGAVVAYNGYLFISTGIGNTNNTPPSINGGVDNAWWNHYNDYFEIDMFEFDAANTSHPTATQVGIGNWFANKPLYGSTQSTSNPATPCVGGSVGSVCLPGGTDFSQPHYYGVLWVPATGTGCVTTTQGYLKTYFDRVQYGTTFTWNYYNPTAGCYPSPAPANYTSAMSGMDFRHMFLILGSDLHQPTTVYGVTVWQVSGANNITH